MIKNSLVATTIAISLVLSISSEAKARNINSYEDYKLHCSPGAYQYNVQSPYCNQYKKIYENRLQQELNYGITWFQPCLIMLTLQVV